MRWAWAVAGTVLLGTVLLGTGLLGTGVASGAAPIEANLEVVGRWEGDGQQSYGDVAVVGTTAVVTTEAVNPCLASSVPVIDLKNPRSPRSVSAIPLPPGMRAIDVDAANVSTPAFTGDLVAVALAPSPGCAGATGAAVVLHDISDPAQPRSLGRTPGTESVSLAQRSDGRVLAARVTAVPPGVAFDDVSDPARPVALAEWPDPEPPPTAAACSAAGVVLRDEGTGAVVLFADGRVYDVNLAEPRSPSASEAAPGANAPHAAVLPLGKRTIALASEDSCGVPDVPLGLRVLVLGRESGLREDPPLRFPGAGAPGRLVASGALVYVAWHGDGVRVIDFGQVRARTVAQFVPELPDVVGVALLPQHIVVTDSGSGLYVLDRPEEAGRPAGFWSQFLSLLPYLGFAGFMAGAFVVPRLAMGYVGAGSRLPSPVPHRRRA